ncbi:MAG: LUD domain-containing protein [Chloroflexi bacterium]|nr:LUD domain-containing protein [Chloroflexota bacterium]
MRAGPGRGRLASLLPPVHIALVRPEQFFPSLAAFLAHHRPPECRYRGLAALFREPSSLTVISGPSRTADIEMTLTIGVHGPGELHVLCIRD